MSCICRAIERLIAYFISIQATSAVLTPNKTSPQRRWKTFQTKVLRGVRTRLLHGVWNISTSAPLPCPSPTWRPPRQNVVGKLSLRHCLADLERRGPKGRITCEEEGCRWCCFKKCAAVDEQRCNTEIRHVGASRGSDATGSARWKPKSRRRLRRPRRASAWL
ncbi:hypothetical protein IQ07DRAFT_18889 [Pyrenochaeta sp. DS3sAY3a]|nr:hypothetical protein IQ07DRAFT_18889 [Pyrenochaeta sp. DS3sAY3a]